MKSQLKASTLSLNVSEICRVAEGSFFKHLRHSPWRHWESFIIQLSKCISHLRRSNSETSMISGKPLGFSDAWQKVEDDVRTPFWWTENSLWIYSADFKTPSAGLRYRIGFTSYIPLSILVTVPCAENTDPTAGKIGLHGRSTKTKSQQKENEVWLQHHAMECGTKKRSARRT